MKKFIKTIFYAAFGVIFCSISACKKTCKTYTQYETAPVILEYFGNYKPGNYWIYENQDGTKKDSMWVSDYEERLYKDSDPCYSFPQIDFIVHSKYLYENENIKTSIENNGYCCRSGFYMKDSTGRHILGTHAKIDDGELSGIKIETNYTLNSKNPIIFPKVTFAIKRTPPHDTLIIAEKIGIIRFVGINSDDTFSLIKYYIK